jgi:hypothetical protein
MFPGTLMMPDEPEMLLDKKAVTGVATVHAEQDILWRILNKKRETGVLSANGKTRSLM